jgi:hypothetical protein
VNALIVRRKAANFTCEGHLAEEKFRRLWLTMAAFNSDSSTMTGKTISVYDPKPIAYKAVRVWLSDGSRTLGMWTGTKWWSLQGEIKPVRWELEERKKKKTDKLRKTIAKQFA